MTDKREIIKNARNVLKKHGSMAAITLSYLLKEEYMIDVDTSKLVQLIRIYGKDDISFRRPVKERGFGFRDRNDTLIYEARGRK